MNIVNCKLTVVQPNVCNQQTKDTPLIIGARNSDEKMVRLLLEYEADPRQQNANKETPLTIAVQSDAQINHILPLLLAKTRANSISSNHVSIDSSVGTIDEERFDWKSAVSSHSTGIVGALSTTPSLHRLDEDIQQIRHRLSEHSKSNTMKTDDGNLDHMTSEGIHEIAHYILTPNVIQAIDEEIGSPEHVDFHRLDTEGVESLAEFVLSQQHTTRDSRLQSMSPGEPENSDKADEQSSVCNPVIDQTESASLCKAAEILTASSNASETTIATSETMRAIESPQRPRLSGLRHSNTFLHKLLDENDILPEMTAWLEKKSRMRWQVRAY